MPKLAAQTLTLTLLIAAAGCGPKQKPATPLPAAQATPAAAPKAKVTAKTTTKPTAGAPAKPATAAQAADRSGVYTNGGGATLTISKYVANGGFAFKLVIKSKDDCDLVDYSGTAKFSGPTKATSDKDDAFTLKGQIIAMEPSVDMIGMACARVIHVDFTKKK